ncbi:MAG: hypothetical protein ACK4GW_05025 [Pseudorhodobacter sp.]
MDRPDLMQVFATCAGRLSAVMEFQWLTDGPASEATARARQSMIALTDAATPTGSEPRALHLRIEAKAAQAGLLHAAYFRGDGRAGDRAEALMAECRGLLLG